MTTQPKIPYAALAAIWQPISEEYKYDDDHEPEPEYRPRRHFDLDAGSRDPQAMPFHPNNGTAYFESLKPLTKRQKRRLRGKR